MPAFSRSALSSTELITPWATCRRVFVTLGGLLFQFSQLPSNSVTFAAEAQAEQMARTDPERGNDAEANCLQVPLNKLEHHLQTEDDCRSLVLRE